MNSKFKTAVASIILCLSAPVMAQEIPAEVNSILKSRTCLACHGVDKKIVGPAFKDIQAKYEAKDEAYLKGKIKNGGKGVWGPIPMPAQAAITDSEIDTVAKWLTK